ncbi:MAG: DNA polymerase beta superfamily protein [Rhodospirillaceae bacterium]
MVTAPSRGALRDAASRMAIDWEELRGGQVLAAIALGPAAFGLPVAAGDTGPVCALIDAGPAERYVSLHEAPDRATYTDPDSGLTAEILDVRRVLRRLVRSDPEVWQLCAAPDPFWDQDACLARIRLLFREGASLRRQAEHFLSEAKRDISVYFQDPLSSTLAQGAQSDAPSGGLRIKYPRLVHSLAAGRWLVRKGTVPPLGLKDLLDAKEGGTGPDVGSEADQVLRALLRAREPVKDRNAALDAWIDGAFAEIRDGLEGLSEAHPDPGAADALFRSLVLPSSQT